MGAAFLEAVGGTTGARFDAADDDVAGLGSARNFLAAFTAEALGGSAFRFSAACLWRLGMTTSSLLELERAESAPAPSAAARTSSFDRELVRSGIRLRAPVAGMF